MEKSFRHLTTITALFVAVLIVSNVASAKMVAFGPFSFDGGTLLFPLSYIFGDILTEVYGYRQSRKVIWLGFLAALLMAVTFIVVGKLPPAADWGNQAAYDAILGLTPRIVAASLIAYLAGEFSNSYVLAKLKVRTAGRFLWLRTIGSTLIGEGVDTLLFVTIAFYGVGWMTPSLFWTVVVSNYVFKTLVEAAFTPVTYKVVSYLKKTEGVDHYDRDTNFNPLAVFGKTKSEPKP